MKDWRHLEGKMTPTDFVSRGLMPCAKDLHQECFEIPRSPNTNKYPEEAANEKTPDDDSEKISLTTAIDDYVLARTSERFSDCGKWIRAIMICLISLVICQKLPDSDDSVMLHTQAEKVLLKYCQEKAFSDDLKQLKTSF